MIMQTQIPKILIVEDEIIVAKDISVSLKSLGYEVAGIAANGVQAMELIKTLRPDLVLMDVMLQGGMDGIEVAQKACAEGRTPVVFLTAYADDDTLRRAKKSEAYGYLLKPFEDRELRMAIEMALYKHTMEHKLRESREWLETTLRSIGDAVIAMDADAKIQFINQSAEVMTGWSQAEAFGRPASDIFCLKTTEDCLIHHQLKAILNGIQSNFKGKNAVLVSRGSKKISIDYTAAPIRDSEGQMTGVVVIFRDITESKLAAERERQLYDRLAKVKRLESQGVLADGVAHDLNNILGPIAAYPDLIMKALPRGNSARADLAIIKNSVHKALEIIRDLLTIGRSTRAKMEPLDVNELIAGTLRSLSGMSAMEHASAVNLEFQPAPDLGIIQGAESQLQAMITNIVLNAYAAMPEGGRLQLTTAAEMLSKPLEGYETIPPGRYAVISVTDSGAGFTEEDLNRFFEPFYVKKKLKSQTGTGLGMAVVYEVVKEHNGFVNIQSALDKGTRFDIYMPFAADETEEALPAPRENSDLHGMETILLIDDDEEQRGFAARSLRSLGYQVLTASNGPTAVEMHAAALAGGKEIDLLVIDLVLGDDMDGLDTYRNILKRAPYQRAIVVSGFAMTDRIKEIMHLGAGYHLQKPYNQEELGKFVRRELDRE